MSHENIFIREEREPIKCSRSAHKGQDYSSKYSNPSSLSRKTCEECYKNHKVKEKPLSSHINFAGEGASTCVPSTFLRSSLLDNSSTSIDSLSDFELPQQHKYNSMDNPATSVRFGQQDSCTCNDPEPHENCNLFTEPNLNSNPSSCESDNSCNFKEEKATNISSEKKDSSPLLSDSFIDNLDAQFIEELCKCRENSSEGWSSYYELLNNIVRNSLKENTSPFSYVHRKGEDISGLDNFDDDYSNSDTVVNRSNTTEDSTFQEKLNKPSTFGGESVVATDSNTKTSSNTVKGRDSQV